MQLWKLIKEKMCEHSEQTVGEKDKVMSYEELIVFSETFAEKLKGLQCCAIVCGNEMAAAMALLACFAAQVTAVPLSVRYGELHCNKIIDRIKPNAIITDINGELEIIQSPHNYIKPTDRPALIMCTSGTTGRPKGAMLSEQNIITNLNDICDYFDIAPMDTILISRPLYHAAVLTGEFLTALMKGARILFYSERFNPKVLLDYIEKNKVTVFCGTPTSLSLLARFVKKDVNVPLQTIGVSGENLDKTTGQKIAETFKDARIYHLYGMTEASPRISYLPPDLFNCFPDSAGVPLKSVSLKIIDKSGKIVKENEEGILWVKGDNVMMGYYGDEELTRTVLENGWLCTGDVALIDSNGLLRIKGRSDDMIIRAGMNIYPQEIEAALKQDSRVEEVFAYKIKSEKQGERIGLKISGNFKNADEVKAMCIKMLPEFQIPTQIELLKELPKNASYKIIRR